MARKQVLGNWVKKWPTWSRPRESFSASELVLQACHEQVVILTSHVDLPGMCGQVKAGIVGGSEFIRRRMDRKASILGEKSEPFGDFAFQARFDLHRKSCVRCIGIRIEVIDAGLAWVSGISPFD